MSFDAARFDKLHADSKLTMLRDMVSLSRGDLRMIFGRVERLQEALKKGMEQLEETIPLADAIEAKAKRYRAAIEFYLSKPYVVCICTDGEIVPYCPKCRFEEALDETD